MLIEQGNVQEHLDAMIQRGNFKQFSLSRQEQNLLNSD